jgi:formyl-CoA transferase
MGRGELVRDARFDTLSARKENEEVLDEIVRAWTKTQDKRICAEQLQKIGVAASPVQDLRDLYERDPQTRDHYQIVHQPTAPEIDVPIDREPARWMGFDHRLNRSPGIGEHTEEILKGLLGVSDEEFIELLVEGVLE